MINEPSVFELLKLLYMLSYLLIRAVSRYACMILNVRKRTFRHVRPTKIQRGLRFSEVWSESSLGTFFYSQGCKVSSSKQRRLIRLSRCAGWVYPSFGAIVRNYVFSGRGSHIFLFHRTNISFCVLFRRAFQTSNKGEPIPSEFCREIRKPLILLT